MKRVSSNYIGQDLESSEIIDKTLNLIEKGYKMNIIPTTWRNEKVELLNNIQKELLKPHSEEYSDSVNKQLRELVINLESATNTSKV